ncbi:MAG: AsmA family protein [Cyclobacteriaceae bacterium]
MLASTSRNILSKTLLIIAAVVVLIPLAIFAVAYFQKDAILDKALEEMNRNFQGKVAIEAAQISPFENFPYISIDLRNVEVHETKSQSSDTVIYVEDAYVGFDLLSILNGDFEVKKIKLQNGFVRIVQDREGSLNISQALSSGEAVETDSSESSTSFQLEAIELINIDLLKLNEETNILVEAFIENAVTTQEVAIA